MIKKINLSSSQKIFTLWSIVVGLALISGLVFTLQTNWILKEKESKDKEAARPVQLNLKVVYDSTCPDCSDLKPLIDAIKAKNVAITEEKNIDYQSDEGKLLVEKYGLEKIPGLIIAGELQKNSELATLWQNLGEIKNGEFILRQVGAPYREISSNEIKGRVKVILLADKNCADCYDVNRHLNILASMSLPIADRQLLDVNDLEGKNLINEYQIKSIPTLILTGDLAAYVGLKNIWSQVGTIETDGTYVFRNGVTQMGVYRDLVSNKIIRSAVNQNQSPNANP